MTAVSGKPVFMTTKKRSIAKAISWRVMAILVLGVISYLVTGDWEKVSLITVMYHGFQIGFYYVHERLWDRIHWGQVKHPLADLVIKQPLTEEDMRIIRDQLRALGYID
jgi:uncharacterized membrane protein